MEKKEVSLQKSKHVAKDPFYLCGGNTKFYSLHELLSILETADDVVFSHHVNAEKNDFAAWIRHSMANHALANRISKLGTREDVIIAIKEYLQGKEGEQGKPLYDKQGNKQGNKQGKEGKPEEKIRGKLKETREKPKDALEKPKALVKKVRGRNIKAVGNSEINSKKGGKKMENDSQADLSEINKLISELEEETQNIGAEGQGKSQVKGVSQQQVMQEKPPAQAPQAQAGQATGQDGQAVGQDIEPVPEQGAGQEVMRENKEKKKKSFFSKIFSKKESNEQKPGDRKSVV